MLGVEGGIGRVVGVGGGDFKYSDSGTFRGYGTFGQRPQWIQARNSRGNCQACAPGFFPGAVSLHPWRTHREMAE